MCREVTERVIIVMHIAHFVSPWFWVLVCCLATPSALSKRVLRPSCLRHTFDNEIDLAGSECLDRLQDGNVTPQILFPSSPQPLGVYAGFKPTRTMSTSSRYISIGFRTFSRRRWTIHRHSPVHSCPADTAWSLGRLRITGKFASTGR